MIFLLFWLFSEGEKKSLFRRIYEWFDPVVYTETHWDTRGREKITGGIVTQKITGPLVVGLGGRYVQKQDTIENYFGIGRIGLNFRRWGRVWGDYCRLLKGEEKLQYEVENRIGWDIPNFLGNRLIIEKQYKWGKETKGEVEILRLEKNVEKDIVFYNVLQRELYKFKYENREDNFLKTCIGGRSFFYLTPRMHFFSEIGMWKDIRRNKICETYIIPWLNYWSQELRYLVIKLELRGYEFEKKTIFELKTIFPIGYNFYLGVKFLKELITPIKGEIRKQYERIGGIIFGKQINKIRIVGYNREKLFPIWEGGKFIKLKGIKVILSPVKSIQFSVKYTTTQNKFLTSLWIHYLHKIFKIGIGVRVLSKKNGEKEYGISIGGGIREWQKFPFIRGYTGGINLLGIEDKELVSEYYWKRSYYIKTYVNEETIEALFEDE